MINAKAIVNAAEEFGTPLYLYDEAYIRSKCKIAKAMPNAFGLTVRYAAKANATKVLVQIIESEELEFDIQGMDEARRVHMAGVPYHKMKFTAQEIPIGEDRLDLQRMILEGMTYNVGSITQLEMIARFIKENNINLSIRLHPGIGSGKSSTRNTGNKYSCFGVYSTDYQRAIYFAKENGIVFDEVHGHIGSGSDPKVWKEFIPVMLHEVGERFKDAHTLNLGGGYREQRMPDDRPADILELGEYAKVKFQEFYDNYRRALHMEIEPGTNIIANSGYIIKRVMDIKRTDGLTFLINNGGMELNARPMFYGSQHPFYIISKDGELLSSDFGNNDENPELVPVGRVCESGDCDSLDDKSHIVPRKMALPKIGDYFVVGGVGAYCVSMAPSNYCSNTKAAQVLLRPDSDLKLIEPKQTMEQLTQNELSLKELNSS